MKRPSPLDAENPRWPRDVGVSLLGLGLFVIGLTAPLTPSRGCPSALALGVFAAVPVLLLFVVASRRVGIARIVLSLQAVLIAAATLWLLIRLECPVGFVEGYDPEERLFGATVVGEGVS